MQVWRPLNGYCPSRIDVTICKSSKKCTVKLIAYHNNDSGNLPLNKVVWDNIGRKMSQNIPFEHILNKICDNILNNSLERTHILQKKIYIIFKLLIN